MKMTKCDICKINLSNNIILITEINNGKRELLITACKECYNILLDEIIKLGNKIEKKQKENNTLTKWVRR